MPHAQRLEGPVSIFFRPREFGWVAFASVFGTDDQLPATLPVIQDHPDRKGNMYDPTRTELRSMQWNYVTQPYLGFLPTHDFFHGSIWGRFGGSRKFFASHIVATKEGYVLHPAVADSWVRMENAISAILGAIKFTAKDITWGVPLKPADVQYWLPGRTKEQVLSKIMFAQKLFLNLGAQLAHSIATKHKAGPWIDIIVNHSEFGKKYTKEWLKDLNESPVLNQNRTDRAGFLIDGSRMDRMTDVLKFRDWKVPTFVAIAHVEEDGCGSYAITMLPGADELSELFDIESPHTLWNVINRLLIPEGDGASEGPQTTFIDNSSASPYVPTPAYTAHFNDYLESPESPSPALPSPIQMGSDAGLPDPHPRSGQRPGQNWNDFFLRRSELNEKHALNATPEERQKRLHKKNNARAYNLPGCLPRRLKASVFQWVASSTHPEFFLRTPVDPEDVADVWDDFTSHQRIFDISANQWDLCGKLPEGVISEQESRYRDNLAHDDDNDDLFPANRRPLEPPLAVIDVDADDAMDKDEVERVASLFKAGNIPTPFYPRDPVGYAEHRFGMLLQTNAVKRINWFLSLGVDHDGDVKKLPLCDNIGFIVNKIISRKPTFRLQDFVNILDIHTSNSPLLSASHLPKLRRLSGTKMEQGMTQRVSLYFIHFSNEKTPDAAGWVMALESAANVVLAIREGWVSSRRAMVRQLLLHGVPFHTLVSKPSEDLVLPDSMPKILVHPIAQDRGQFRLTHYFNYHEAREDFLDTRHAGVAGRSGGIVARLWRKNADRFDSRMNVIMQGPTEYAVASGSVFNFGDDRIYYDDSLSSNIAGLVCGAYVSSNPTQTQERISWYPLQSAWLQGREGSTLRWTESDEKDTHKREQAILRANTYTFKEGGKENIDTPQPLNQTTWKKHEKTAGRKLDEGYEVLAQEFLSHYASLHSLHL